MNPHLIQVFPHTEVNGKVVKWNSVIYQRKGTKYVFWKLTSALPSPELAQANAENWLQRKA